MLIPVQLQHLATQAQTKLHIAYLIHWHSSIFDNKLRTTEAENP